jgi:outer membrane protein OmpA-like peptidoglycan-associated protein
MKNIISIVLLIFTMRCATAQSLHPTETHSLMEVSFLDFKEKPRANQKILFQSQSNKKIYAATTNEKGIAQLLLPEGDYYQIRCVVFSDTVDYDLVTIEKEEGAFSYQLTLKYEPPRQFTLRDVHFETGKANITPSSYSRLNELYDAMVEIPDLVIEISGHTDNVGKPEDNLKLSQLRADAIRNYLIQKGISPNRIIAKGYGSLQPVAPNDTEAGRAKNRRTEVRIIKE